jgi:hypothetical protein
MNRRHFIANSFTASLAFPAFLKTSFANPFSEDEFPYFTCRKLTSAPHNHFFGYYGMSPWNSSETKMIGLESTFHERMPKPGELAKVGLIDPSTGKFEPISETKAWNLQQGAMLHWNPVNPDTEIIFNDQQGDELISYILNINSGKKTILPRAISGVTAKGKHALGINYGRLSRMRKVVGYANAKDPFAHELHPVQDGLFLINLETLQTQLIISISEVFERSVAAYPLLKERDIWFNHSVFSPSGNRVLFLARTRNAKNKLDSSMFTVNIDGTDVKQVLPFGTGVSHFGWRNEKEIIATFKLAGEKEIKHFLFKDGDLNFNQIGKSFIVDDGHPSFSPDGRWMCTDRKQDESHSQSLWLFDMNLNKGTLLTDIPYNNHDLLHSNTRCDFHPRWSPSGQKICFDALDNGTGTRQMHLIEFINI